MLWKIVSILVILSIITWIVYQLSKSPKCSSERLKRIGEISKIIPIICVVVATVILILNEIIFPVKPPEIVESNENNGSIDSARIFDPFKNDSGSDSGDVNSETNSHPEPGVPIYSQSSNETDSSSEPEVHKDPSQLIPSPKFKVVFEITAPAENVSIHIDGNSVSSEKFFELDVEPGEHEIWVISKDKLGNNEYSGSFTVTVPPNDTIRIMSDEFKQSD